jgi:F-type H+-transporting ATPase subunit delta
MDSRGRIAGYAAALVDVFRAEGDLDGLTDEFFSAAQALESSPDLRETLGDPRLPVERKQNLVSDLLGQRASKVTVAAIDLLIATGHTRDLTAVAERLADVAAAEHGAVLAEVRSAGELDQGQITRLEAALSSAVGRKVEVVVIVDPKVVGGVVTKIGDTVFDGSVRARLDELKEQWG